jgi:hypothetical protein
LESLVNDSAAGPSLPHLIKQSKAMRKKKNIGEQPEQTAFGFVENHPLIRDPKTYSDFVNHYQ